MRVFIPGLAAASAAALAAGALIASGTAPAVTAAGPASRAAHRVPSARFVAEARAALARYLAHGHQPAVLARPVRSQAPGAVTTEYSYNWAGYLDQSTKDGTFTKVSGSWTVPSVSCTREDTLSAEWVGFDGFSASPKTVEQEGTFGWCFRDKPTYYTWYDMYPANTVEVGKSLRPGDKISASISRSGSSYTLKLTDSTHAHNGFAEKKTCATSTCLDRSAEWMVERPSFPIGIAPLADYDTWQLTKGAETAGGKSGTIGSYATVDDVEMIDATGSYELSTPSSLSGSNSFSAKWDNSY